MVENSPCTPVRMEKGQSHACVIGAVKSQVAAQDNDDMDASDRGSDSEEDSGAKARRVLEECSALSKKLASVISSWAATTIGDKNSLPSGTSGALELTQMSGKARAATTNDEIEIACPGLKLNP